MTDIKKKTIGVENDLSCFGLFLAAITVIKFLLFT